MADGVGMFFRLLCFNVLTTVCIAVGNMDDLFATLGGLADILGSGDKCEFGCPNGWKPKENPDHVPKSNGCGSYGLKLDTDSLPGMTKCCDNHDICYDTCGSNRTKCDKHFKQCLQDMCKIYHKKHTTTKYEGCLGTTELMYTGITALGCNAFIKSQRNACMCSGTGGRRFNSRSRGEL